MFQCSGSWPLASHHDGMDSIPGQSMWDLWWTIWHSERFPEHQFYPVSMFHQCSKFTFIHLPLTLHTLSAVKIQLTASFSTVLPSCFLTESRNLTSFSIDLRWQRGLPIHHDKKWSVHSWLQQQTCVKSQMCNMGTFLIKKKLTVPTRQGVECTSHS